MLTYFFTIVNISHIVIHQPFQVLFEPFGTIGNAFINNCLQPLIHDSIVQIRQLPVDSLSPPQSKDHSILLRQRKVPVDHRQKSFFFLGQLSLQLFKKIKHMVADKGCLYSLEMFDKEADFFYCIFIFRRGELPVLHHFIKPRSFCDFQRSQPDIIGIDGINGLCRGNGMLSGPTFAP